VKNQIYLCLLCTVLTLNTFAMNQQFEQHCQNEKQYPKITITASEQQKYKEDEDISQNFNQSKNIISLREVRIDEISLDLSLPKALKTIKRLTGKEISLEDLKLKPPKSSKKYARLLSPILTKY
jgi:hypothetical protein